jgi:hypothetical protein
MRLLVARDKHKVMICLYRVHYVVSQHVAGDISDCIQ